MADKKLYVCNTVLIKQFMKSYLIYNLLGEQITTPLLRRLKDFVKLRELLRTNWPGFTIPQLPDTITEDTDYTDLINYFLSVIITQPDLLSNYEIKLFLSNEPDFSNIYSSMQPD